MEQITDRLIDQAYSELKSDCGGTRNDYFGVVYLEQVYKLHRRQAANQIAFGGNDYGIDGFHFDAERRNLYLFQFKWTTSYTQFKQPLQRLIDAGLDRIFNRPNQDSGKNEILASLRSCIVENRNLIDQVCIHFVFKGDASQAEQSYTLEKLCEDLQSKKHLIDSFFRDRKVAMTIEFRSVCGKVAPVADTRECKIFPVEVNSMLQQTGPNGEIMIVGFVPLKDIDSMFVALGDRFFERNIRYGLSPDKFVNRTLRKAFRRIFNERRESPEAFAFHHNGITLSAEHFSNQQGVYEIAAPRLLNGAQTVTTFRQFLQEKEQSGATIPHDDLSRLRVLCRIITNAKDEFVTAVTINNNRQTPIEPWSLHANDMIQLQIADKLKDDVGIYYQRQENAFQFIRDMENLERSGIKEQSKAIELLKLAKTFLVTDGNIAALSNIRRVFEEDSMYDQVFNERRLRADSRHIVLCYKIQFRMKRVKQEIVDKGPSKYAFLSRGLPLLWALLCQALLNANDLQGIADEHGQNLVFKAEYQDILSKLASTRCRPLINDLLNNPLYESRIGEGDYSFLKTNAAYKFCMERAYDRWKWIERRLAGGLPK